MTEHRNQKMRRGKKLENERKEERKKERKKFRLQRQGNDQPSSDAMLETK